jgi:hypothetical protein
MMSTPSLSAQYSFRGVSILMCSRSPFNPICRARRISIRVKESLGKV